MNDERPGTGSLSVETLSDGDGRPSGRHAAEVPPEGAEPIEIVRSEERLRVQAERIPIERVRIERYIVTEQQTFTVEVSHEEMRVIREPIDDRESLASDSDRSDSSGPDFSADRISSLEAAASSDPHPADGGDLVITLSREEVEFTKRVVPVEVVRVRTTRVAENQEITTNLSREELDLSSPDGDGRLDSQGFERADGSRD